MFHVKHWLGRRNLMPVYNSVLLDIDAKETRRYAGLNKAKDFDEKLIEEACLEARLLAEPRGIWQMYDYDAATQTVLADPPFTMKGKLIGKHLAKAQKVIVLSASVGDAIEEHVTKYFADGRYAYSVILDAAATAAVEQVADAKDIRCAGVSAQATAIGRSISSPKWYVSPKVRKSAYTSATPPCSYRANLSLPSSASYRSKKRRKRIRRTAALPAINSTALQEKLLPAKAETEPHIRHIILLIPNIRQSENL